MWWPGADFVAALRNSGVTHVVYIPDSSLGLWEPALASAGSPCLIRPTREGEGLAIAAGLLLGGAVPVVVIQCTGLFEAGDALRNVVHDLGLPLCLVVGVRSWHASRAGARPTTVRRLPTPILDAWQIPHSLIDPQTQPVADFEAALRRASNRAGRASCSWRSDKL